MLPEVQNQHLDKRQIRQIWLGRIWRFLSVMGMFWIVVLLPVSGEKTRLLVPIFFSASMAVSMLFKREPPAQIRASIWILAIGALAISIIFRQQLTWYLQLAICTAYVSFAMSSRYLIVRMPDLVMAPPPERSVDPQSS